MELANRTVKALFQEYNYGKFYNKSHMIYCRPSVERYIFFYLNEKLKAMYLIKNRDVNEQYETKKKLFENFSGFDLLKLLEVNENFIPDNEIINTIPYESPIRIFNQLNTKSTPREKLKCLTWVFNELKANVIEYTHGEYELKSTENMIKLFQYLIINSDIDKLGSELDFLKDYLSLQEDKHESESFIILNLQVSLV